MDITKLLAPERVRCGVKASSKKRSLEMLAELLTGDEADPSTRTVFENLIGRERLGSTGLGKGVALPHARVPGVTEAGAALLRLDEPVDFDALDRQPVDLLFALLVPENSTDEHLRMLARLAEMFSDTALCETLRRCESAAELYDAVLRWQQARGES